MAICPECLSFKPFFARRCAECNEEIGFWRQTFAMYVYLGTVVLVFYFVMGSIFSATILWGVLLFWLAWIIVPLFTIWVFLVFYYWLFD